MALKLKAVAIDERRIILQGSDIKSYLKAKGIRQTFLAEKINIPAGILNMMLNNSRKIEVNEYIAICNALELPLDYFVKPVIAGEEVK